MGETVGVIGVGLVGNLVAQIARAAGCKVVCLDMRDDRLRLAKEVGADLALKSDDTSLLAHISHFTKGRGLDSVLVCAATSSSEPLNLAGRLAKSGGRVVVVGRVGMDIERKDFFQKELKLLMSRSLGPGRYDPVYEEQGVDYPVEYVRWTLNRNMEAFLDLVATGRINIERLIAAEFPLDKAPEAYDSLGKQTGVALLLTYPDARIEERPKTVGDLAPAKKTGAIGVGLVGPGNFAKETIIPILRSSPDYRLKWVVSSNPLHATEAAKRYAFERSTADLNEALGDPELGAVIIASPNNLHFSMLIQTIKAGKTALVEKPLCITREELEELKKVHQDTRAPIIVGFNRRYAPLILQMKSKMAELDGPFVLTYRVNAGFVPVSKWSQDAQVGGGRIIHECCHFFDLFNFLLGADNPDIQAATSGINNSSSVARDNLTVTLKYPDGSLATLVYVAMGNKGMDRERMEVFAQGTSMILDDFKELHVYGEKPTTVRLARSDKGHLTEFSELAKFQRGLPSSIITSEEAFLAMDLTFKVDEAARKAPQS
jgi:predicted dehydrogenase